MIEINNLTTLKIDEEFLKKVAKEILIKEKQGLANLSIAFVGPERMRALNKKYRKKNRTTDILAFPESKIFSEKFKNGPLEKIQGLGEIVICLKEVKKNSRRFGETFEKELTRVLIHGILHLLGYDHEKEMAKAKIMKEKEEYYLKLFG